MKRRSWEFDELPELLMENGAGRGWSFLKIGFRKFCCNFGVEEFWGKQKFLRKSKFSNFASSWTRLFVSNYSESIIQLFFESATILNREIDFYLNWLDGELVTSRSLELRSNFFLEYEIEAGTRASALSHLKPRECDEIWYTRLSARNHLLDFVILIIFFRRSTPKLVS